MQIAASILFAAWLKEQVTLTLRIFSHLNVIPDS